MAKLLSKKVIICGCLVAIVLTITAPWKWHFPRHLSVITAKFESTVSEQSPQTLVKTRPVLVTAFSSNHFGEAQAMFFAIHKYLPDYRVVAYDLGLTKNERERTEKYCRCELRTLLWDRYPAHVRELMTYAFKPVIVNETVNEFGFIFWIDSSIRMISSAVEPLWNFTISMGFAAAQDSHVTHCFTHPAMFAALNVSQSELYKRARVMQAAFLLFTDRRETIENIVAPWLQCALNRECIAPTGSSVHGCITANSPSYCNCHRFDQAALEIILYKYYPGQFVFDPVKREGPLAPFSLGTWENFYPQFDVLKVTRGDVKDYFPPK